MSPNFAEFLLDGADNGNEILAVLDDIVEVVETGGSDLYNRIEQQSSDLVPV